ncbi:transcriptional regulator, TetR family [Xylanimonas cellulosilytica DSM 15894]|uniref:Transcriptional regulator, TetR family n=1 Tax=Xylanimonas cellulosilytica (strain DSM 15894 / JCM 12276 / CECT 5975 / KCTC 9989 / LMG 20990 / NBRC 107835 / XIL07) TaxID=446471 RepID=D1BU84_XYLCX|nr:TetR/AcrR family transcriptional regulator [Xylanimonas cellulosilytica]ACZ31097.1 transcriptional regulator, TetR family [Xylanimonas cellulosilytica DSM 15894]
MRSKQEDPGRAKPSFIEQARRAQIVEAAAEVVAEVGYARTSFARIAAKAGISKGVITYHFDSKDEILRLVATEFFAEGWRYIEARIAAEETAAGQVRAWIGSELEFFGAHRTRFLAMSDIIANHRTEDGSHAYASELAEEVDGLTEILRRGQHDGELRPFDARSVANIILRCTTGVLETWATNPETDLEAESVVLLDFIDHAIGRKHS